MSIQADSPVPKLPGGVPLTTSYCRSAARAASALSVCASTAAGRDYWRRVEQSWLNRAESAPEGEQP